MNRRSFLTGLAAVTATALAPIKWAASKVRGVQNLRAWDPLRGDLYYHDGDCWTRLTRETLWEDGEMHPMCRSSVDIDGELYGCAKPRPVRSGNESTTTYRPNQRVTHRLREDWPMSLEKDDFGGEHDPGTRQAALDLEWGERLGRP